MANIFSKKLKWGAFFISLLLMLAIFKLIVGNFGSLYTEAKPSLCSNLMSAIGSIAVSPRGDKLIISDMLGRIIVVDTKTDSIAANIPLPIGERYIAFAPDNSKVFVLGTSSTEQLKVIDLRSNSFIETLSFPNEFRNVKSFAISKNGMSLYVVASVQDKQYLLVLDLRTGNKISSIALEDKPKRPLIISKDGTRLYLAGQFLTTINTSTGTIESAIKLEKPLEDSLGGVAIDQTGSLISIGITGSPGFVSIFKINDSSPPLLIDLGVDSSTTKNEKGIIFPESIAFTPTANELYVVHHYRSPGKVSIVDVNNHSVIDGFNLSGDFPIGITFTENGKKAYVVTSNNDGSSIEVIDVINKSLLKKIPLYVIKAQQSCVRPENGK